MMTTEQEKLELQNAQEQPSAPEDPVLPVCQNPERELGLVFSGGGMKGGYEVGVWKALEEKGITKRITAVSGTSVGALNAMMFAKGDLEFAENLWLGVTEQDLMYLPEKPPETQKSEPPKEETTDSAEKTSLPFSVMNLPTELSRRLAAWFPADVPVSAALQNLLGGYWQDLMDTGVFSQKKLESMIDSFVTVQDVPKLARELYVTCTRVTKASYLLDRDGGCERKTFDVKRHAADFKKILLASAAIPAVYPPVLIGEGRFVDGGLAEGGNTPVAPLYERGYRRMIVVYLQKKPEARIRKRDFPFAEFAEIIPGEELYTGPLAAMHMPEGGMASELDAGYWDALGTCTF